MTNRYFIWCYLPLNVVPLLCFGLSLFSIFLLIYDISALVHIKKAEKTLQTLYIAKEKCLSKRLESSTFIPSVNQKIRLDPSETLVTLAKLCESSHLTLSKMQIKKIKPTKLSSREAMSEANHRDEGSPQFEESFEVSLDLFSSYSDMLSLFFLLYQQVWLSDFKMMMLKKTTSLEPIMLSAHNLSKSDTYTAGLTEKSIEIKLKLSILSTYFPSQKIKSLMPFFSKSTPLFSPFLMRRYVGKIETLAEGLSPQKVLLLETEGQNTFQKETHRSIPG
jgi:hypothetical protein